MAANAFYPLKIFANKEMLFVASCACIRAKVLACGLYLFGQRPLPLPF